MKTFVLMIALVLSVAMTSGQVVLNEVYTDPGAGNHEFFELYNTSTSTTPEDLDSYTILTYYEEAGGKSGFYILDLPNQSISARSFYVGASASSFNVQGKTNMTANFSWNLMPAGGALTKWEKNGSSYVQVSVPANLNDLFVKRNGSGGVQHIFIFKNGILINSLIGGMSSNVVPAYIKAMPDIFVDMTGASPDFTFSPSNLKDNQLEYNTATVGTDNGYIRSKDGACSSWLKSTAQAQHTPGTTNGSATGTTGDLTIAAYITYGNPSILNYNITAGTTSVFPVNVQVYRDLGVAGQLDPSDVLIDSRTITSSSDGTQQIILPAQNDGVMIVCKSPAGCYDNVKAVASASAPLPVKLTSFNGSLNNSKISLQWTVAENEIADMFEVEKSFDGTKFTTAALVFGSDRAGMENYQFAEIMNTEKVFYRLRMTDKSQVVTYSKILMFQRGSLIANNAIRIMNNPVNENLSFSIELKSSQKIDVKIIDLSGRVQMRQTVNGSLGHNYITLQLGATMRSGIYMIDAMIDSERYTAKFVKL